MCVSSRVHEARRLKPKLFSASSRASENQRGIRSFGVDDANVRRPARRASAVRDATRRLARCHEETRRDVYIVLVLVLVVVVVVPVARAREPSNARRERLTRRTRRDATHVHQRLGRDRARYDIEWNKNQRKRCGGERLGQRRAKVRARANFDAHHGARIRRDRLRGVSAFSFGIATDDDDGWFLARRARRLQSELMSLMVRARSRDRRRRRRRRRRGGCQSRQCPW